MLRTRTTIAATGLAFALALAACSGEADNSDTNDNDTNTSNGVETDSGNEENPPPADLNDDLECVDQQSILGPKATGTLTNHSSGLSGYMISVGFLDGGGTRVAEGTAFINGVQSGQTATWEAQSFSDVDFATCEIISVERLAQ